MKISHVILGLTIAIAFVIVGYMVFSNVQSELEIIQGYEQKCIKEFNITNTQLIRYCADGMKRHETLENTRSMDLTGVVLITAGALFLLAILPYFQKE